jgi:two-component system CheB/CheR fusion protein
VRAAQNRDGLSGERISLPADLATAFGLVLHELATNAAKYGALSSDQGRVELNWRLNAGNDAPVLKVVWKERGGPPVNATHVSGFGSQLIRQGLTGAIVNYEFLADGIKCAIELPIPERHG